MKWFTLSSRRCIVGEKKISYDVDMRLARLEGARVVVHWRRERLVQYFAFCPLLTTSILVCSSCCYSPSIHSPCIKFYDGKKTRENAKLPRHSESF